MIIEHYGIKIDIPPLSFGDDVSMRIRDEMQKLGDLTRPRKTPIPKQEQKVRAVMQSLKHLAKMKYDGKSF